MRRSCFEGRERTELLCLALQCMRLIDIAIEAAEEGWKQWWPKDGRFELDTYAKHYVVKEYLGDVDQATAIRKLKRLRPIKAVETLHSIQKLALWQSDRRIPPPDLSGLMPQAERLKKRRKA